MRKRIGILLSQMEENTQKSIMEAFTKEAYAHNYDLCVFFFAPKVPAKRT